MPVPRWAMVPAMDLPQLWELGESAESPLAEAEDLTRAYEAEIGLADRLRGWLGHDAMLWTVDARIVRGTVTEVYRDALLVAGELVTSLIPLAAAVRCRGPRRAHRNAVGRQRASGLSAARELAGREVVVRLLGLPEQRGVLVAVGGDHVSIAVPGGEDLLPWARTTAVEWRTG